MEKSKRREDVLGCNLIKRARLDHLAAVSSPADRKTPQRDSPGHLCLLVRCVRCSVHLRHCPSSAQSCTLARFPRQQPKRQQRDDRSRFQRARHSNMSSAYMRGAGAGYERVRVCYMDVQLGFNSGAMVGKQGGGRRYKRMGKREGVTHKLAITKPRPEIDSCTASRSLRVLYHDQARHDRSCIHAPHGVICAGAKDGLGSTRT